MARPFIYLGAVLIAGGILYIFVTLYKTPGPKGDQKRIATGGRKVSSRDTSIPARDGSSTDTTQSSSRAKTKKSRKYRGPDKLTPEYIEQKKKEIEKLLEEARKEGGIYSDKYSRAGRMAFGLQENVFSYYAYVIGDVDRGLKESARVERWYDRLSLIVQGSMYDGDVIDLIPRIWNDSKSKYWIGSSAAKALDFFMEELRFAKHHPPRYIDMYMDIERLKRIMQELTKIVLHHPTREVRDEAEGVLTAYESYYIKLCPKEEAKIKQRRITRRAQSLRLWRQAMKDDLTSRDPERIDLALSALYQYEDPELVALVKELAKREPRDDIRLIFERHLYLSSREQEAYKELESIKKETPPDTKPNWQGLVDTVLHNNKEWERCKAVSELRDELNINFEFDLEKLNPSEKRLIMGALHQATTDPSEDVRRVARETLEEIEKKIQEKKNEDKERREFLQRLILGPVFGIDWLERYVREFHKNKEEEIRRLKEHAKDRDQRYTEEEIYEKFEEAVRERYFRDTAVRLKGYRRRYGEDAFYKEQAPRFQRLVQELDKLLKENRPR